MEEEDNKQSLQDRSPQAQAQLEIPVDLYDRLIKSKVFQQEGEPIEGEQEAKTKSLTDAQRVQFQNGQAFGKYCIVLKNAMKVNNQDLNIDDITIEVLKEEDSDEVRESNWKAICSELEKIGISIDPDVQELMVKGDKDKILQAFMRIERFLTKIAGKQIFDFKFDTPSQLDNFRKQGTQAAKLPKEENQHHHHHHHTNSIEGNEHHLATPSHARQSLANSPHHRKSTSRVHHAPSHQGSTVHKSPHQPITTSPSFNLKEAPPFHELTIPGKQLSINSKKRGFTEKRLSSIVDSPKKVSPFIQQMTTKSLVTEKSTVGRRGQKPNQKKAVKESVDILQMDVDKQPHETESSLELILNTLCRSFEIKPKQAAALLTNNNQYLIHSVAKGIKGSFQPVLRWFQDLNANSRQLSSLVESETEDFPDSANCQKVLQTISSGMYSPSDGLEVCQWCCRLLTKVFEDFNSTMAVIDIAYKWFLDDEGGFELCLHALSNHSHPDIGDDIANMFSQFIVTASQPSEKFTQIYKERYQRYYTSSSSYLRAILDMLPYIINRSKEELLKTSLLSEWIDIALRLAEGAAIASPDDRICAISFLAEVWFSFPSFVDQNGDLSATFLASLRKCSRERNVPAKLVSISLMFRLLDKFADEKNSSAPVLYKSLIFTFIESASECEIRELYLNNFKVLFKAVPSIPIGLLVDPLLKQLNSPTFLFQMFDFEFLKVLQDHPKLTLAMATSISDCISNVFFTNVIYTSTAQSLLIGFLTKFATDDEIPHMQEYVLSFSSQALKCLLDLEKNGEDLKAQYAAGKNAKAGPAKTPTPVPRKKITKGPKEDPQKALIDGDNEGARLIKKSLIVGIMQRILQIRNDTLNSQIKDVLLSIGKDFYNLFGFFNKGILALLAFFTNNPNQLMQAGLKSKKRPPILQDNASSALAITQDTQEMMTNLMSPINNLDPSQAGALEVYKPQGRSSSQYSKQGRRRSNMPLALPPTDEVSGAGSKLQGYQQKNFEEIEKMRQKKMELMEQKKQEEERKKLASQKKKKRLRDMLDKRKAELGVQLVRKPLVDGRGSIDDLQIPESSANNALIYEEGTLENDKDKYKQRQQKVNIAIIDLEQEEQRDNEAVKACMKKYQKLWRNLFSKYANTGFTTKVAINFDQINEKAQTINYPEVSKLLKEHGMLPQYITKEEVSQLFKSQNVKIGNKAETNTLDYQGYQSLIPQIAFLSFSRPPKDLTSLPLVESLLSMIQILKEATKAKGSSVLLYEDPDISTIPPSEQQLIKALNEKLRSDPQYPIPEGYIKVAEKTPVYDYRIPAAIASRLKESQVVSIELLDSFLNQQFGFHFLEPLISFEDFPKVKPQMNLIKPPQAEALALMSKAADKKKKERELYKDSTAESITPVISEEDQFVKPKLSVELKLAVSQKTLSQRGQFHQVAEVIEEMLSLLVDKEGIVSSNEHLPPRIRKVPGKTMNEARLKKEEDTKKEAENKQKEDEKRKKRKEELKQELLRLKEQKDKEEEEKKRKAEEDKVKEEDKKKKTDEEQKKRSEELKKKIEETKKAKAEEEAKKKQEEEAKEKEETDKRKAAAKEFLKAQKERLGKEFENIAKDRVQVQEKKQEIKQKEIEGEKKLRTAMEGYLKDEKSTALKDQLVRESQQIKEFLDQQDVADLFTKFDRSLRHLYKFYAAQDKLDWSEHNKENMNLREFVRFSFQHRVIPLLIKIPDDSVKLFKLTVKSEGMGAGLQLSFDGFKKILVRIAVFAQDQLGGQQEDLLSERLKKDKEERDAAQKSKKQLYKQSIKEVDTQAIEELKNQFKGLQKKTTVDPQKKIYQDISDERMLEINENLKAQEEAFFQKWLKVQEAKGKLPKKTPKGSRGPSALGEEKLEEVKQAPSSSPAGRKTKEQRMLKNLESKEQAVKGMDIKIDNMQKVSAFQIKKEFDVKIISASTIQALLEFFGIEADAHEYDLDRNLNQHRIDIQGQKPLKVLKQATKAGDVLGASNQAGSSRAGSRARSTTKLPASKGSSRAVSTKPVSSQKSPSAKELPPMKKPSKAEKGESSKGSPSKLTVAAEPLTEINPVPVTTSESPMKSKKVTLAPDVKASIIDTSKTVSQREELKEEDLSLNMEGSILKPPTEFNQKSNLEEIPAEQPKPFATMKKQEEEAGAEVGESSQQLAE